MRLRLLLAIVQRFGQSRLNAALVPLLLVTTATLLGCSSATVAAPATVEVIPPVTEIPEPPVLGECGEDPCTYPCDAVAGDIVVPEKTYWAIRDYLDDWAQYPYECQGAVDDCNESWKLVVRSLAEVEAAKRVEEQVASGGRWEPGRVYFWLIIAAAAGAGIGFATGAIVIALQ